MIVSPTGKKIEIYFSRKKMLKLLAITLLFFVIGCWLIVQPKKTFTYHLIPVPTNILGIGCILFFGAMGVIIFKRFSGNKPAVTIDDLGIEYSKGLAYEYLLWQDMNAVSRMHIKKQKFIMIELKDPAKYIRQKSLPAQLFLKLNQKIWKGHISLSANGMETSFDDLYKLIRERVFRNASLSAD